MNKSFFTIMGSIFFLSNNVRATMEKRTMKCQITYLIVVLFATFFVACDANNNANGAKKADPPVQQNDQRGDEHGGMYMDSTHQGMGGDHRGMDTIHRGMNHGKKGMPKGNN